MTPRTSSTTPYHTSVYDGRAFRGEVIRRSDGFHAIDIFGEEIGIYETKADATRAVVETDEGMRTHGSGMQS